ncbi:unnamed protein product, partial [Ectocarpus sp. 13 AM-2016]
MSKSAARSLLLLLALQLRNGASFLLPSSAITRCSGFVPRSASCGVMRASEADGDTEEAASLNVEDETKVEDEGADGLAKSPAGLTLDGVYKRLTLETQGRADGVVGLESKDTDYAIEVVKVQVQRKPSLGMQLEEVARGGDGRGLVLVAGLEPGGNAEASGKV